MTNKEAIEILEQMKAQIANDRKWLALDRAIRALEARPRVITIPSELIEKLALCVVDAVKNINWDKAFDAYNERPQGEWIPVKYRPLTEGERRIFAEHYGVEYCDTIDEKAFDCPMPKDGQGILISTSWGVVEDVADNEIDGEGFIVRGLESNGDWDGVDAWMPKPEPYKKGGGET